MSKYEQNILILLLTDVTSTGDEGKSVMSATASAGKTLSLALLLKYIIHQRVVRALLVKLRGHQLLGISECIWVTIVPTG